MKKVIVSGANGFVGSNLVKELIKHNIEVYALDKEGCCANLPKNPQVHFIPMNLEDIETSLDCITDRDFDAFFHLAWAGSAGPGRADTNLQLKNAQWTVDSMCIAKKLGCKRFIGAGSIMEQETIFAANAMGNEPGLGYIYGAGKLVAHCMSKSIAADIGIEHIWAIITNAYGEGELSPRFVNTTLRKIIKGEPLQFTSGTQNYDFVHVEDVARAFYMIGEQGKPFCEYAIGSSNAKPLREFIIEMKQALAPERDFLFGDVPFTGIDLPLHKFDCTATERDTGFRAQISFCEGVRRTMQWLKETET